MPWADSPETPKELCSVSGQGSKRHPFRSTPVFAPRQSEVRKLFGEDWIGRLPKVEDHWDYFVQTLVGESGGKSTDLAFSSDSRLLFSFVNKSRVEIWDASRVATGRVWAGSKPVMNDII